MRSLGKNSTGSSLHVVVQKVRRMSLELLQLETDSTLLEHPIVRQRLRHASQALLNAETELMEQLPGRR